MVGLQAGLLTEEGLVWEIALGHTSTSSGAVPMTLDTPLRIGSISKTITSLIAARLEERAIINWEDPIRQHLPDLVATDPSPDQGPVRLLHLAEHTAGWDDMPYRDFISTDKTFTLEQYVRRESADRTSYQPPGSFYRYANGGIAILGAALASAAETDFDTLAKREVFAPLGLSTGGFNRLESAAPSFSPGNPEAVIPWDMPIRPAGALVMSGRDLATIVSMFIHRGSHQNKEWLSKKAIQRLETMESSLAARQGVSRGYAKGLFHFGLEGRFWFGHWGKVDGNLACFGYLPEERRGFFLLSNTSDSRARSAIMKALAKAAAKDLSPSETAPTVEAKLDFEWEGIYLPLLPERELATFPLWALSAVTLSKTAKGIQTSGGIGGSMQSEYSFVTENGLLENTTIPGNSAALISHEGRVYFLPGSPYRKVGFIENTFRKGLLIALPIGGLLSLILFAISLFRKDFRYFPAQGKWTTALFLGYIGFIVQAGVVILLILLRPIAASFEWLAKPSLGSVSLLYLSLLWPGIAFYSVFRICKISCSLRWRIPSGFAALTLLFWAVASIALHWIPFVTWN